MIIKLADIVIEIKLRYRYTYDMCKDYLYDGDENPEFTTFATNEQIIEEREKSPGFSDDVLENTCVYRNICEIILKYDAIFIHSAALSVDNEAYLFSANSGTGKTTHMNLWLDKFKDRAFVINGDKPILRRKDGIIYVYGTPWCGKEGINKNARVPLKSICILERAEKNVIKRESIREAFIFLLSQTIRPKNQDSAQKIFDNLVSITGSVPVYRLGCNMEKEACEVSYKEMSK